MCRAYFLAMVIIKNVVHISTIQQSSGTLIFFREQFVANAIPCHLRCRILYAHYEKLQVLQFNE